MAGDYFAVGGDRGFVFTSKDGLHWETHLLPTPNQIQGLAFGYDRIIAAATDGMLLQSDPLSGPVRTIRGIESLGGNRVRLTLMGVPGTTFEVQRAGSKLSMVLTRFQVRTLRADEL